MQTASPTGFLTVEEFKNITGIKGDDNYIAEALKFGVQTLARKLYVSRTDSSTVQDTIFWLLDSQPTTQQVGYGPCHGLEFADGNLDGAVDKKDIVAYEVDSNGVRTYVSSDINNLDVDRHVITFNSVHPASGKSLIFEFYATYRKLSEQNELFKRLNLLYAANYVFRNVPLRRLQRGIGGWTINGVNVDFQMGLMKDTIKQNEEEIIQIIRDIQRIYIRGTTIHQPTTKPMSYIKSTLHWTSDNI
jgi:hypothetical protein